MYMQSVGKEMQILDDGLCKKANIWRCMKNGILQSILLNICSVHNDLHEDTLHTYLSLEQSVRQLQFKWRRKYRKR